MPQRSSYSNLLESSRSLYHFTVLNFVLLIPGPLKLNSCPLRRIAQAFVIATKTKVDVSEVKIPDHINDEYFRRKTNKKVPRKGDSALFAQGHEVISLFQQCWSFQCILKCRTLE